MGMSRDIKILIAKEKMDALGLMMKMFIKPLPSDSHYVERHNEYMKIERDYDEAVQKYFELTGKGRLDVNGRYF